jgi:protein gp37
LPLRWNRKAGESGERPRIFPSLCDPFDNAVDPAWRTDLFRLIADTPNLDWLLLTKRIGNVPTMLREIGVARLPDNVWLGATIVNQEEADRDIPKLLEVPARVRFLSIEPLLGPVDLSIAACKPCPNAADGLLMDIDTGSYECCRQCDFTGIGDEWGIDWVIVGGESGRGARPMHPDWARSLRDQCTAASVPFLLKQWGEWIPAETDLPGDGACYAFADDGSDRELTGRHRLTSIGKQEFLRLGKRAAGRLLDGRTHDEFPE